MRDGDSLTVLTASERATLAMICRDGDDGAVQGLAGADVLRLYVKKLVARIGTRFYPTEQGREVNERAS